MGSNAVGQREDSLLHPYTNLARPDLIGRLSIDRGEGIRLFDMGGRDYIDALSGLWCVSLGYSNEELIEAARAQLSRLPFAHLFSGRTNDPAVELAEKLKTLAPTPMSKVFFASSGSEANDTQMKLVRYMNNALGRPAKKRFISRKRGYHGVTLASASLTGLPNNHLDFDLPIPDVWHAACPHFSRESLAGESEAEFSDRLVRELEELILFLGPETVAAFIAEPVMGAGGVVVPPRGYFEGVQRVLRKYDVWFIDDEVICGFGRTGHMFGADAFNLKPNSFSVGKALTSGYMPLSAVMVSAPMFEALVVESRKIGAFGHGFTYSGHPVAAAVAVKAIEIYERDGIVQRAAETSKTFLAKLMELKEHPLVGEVRGVGLIGGFDLVDDRSNKTAFPPATNFGSRALSLIEEEGVITRALGDTIALCPPLIITDEEIDEMFQRLRRGLDRALDIRSSS